MKKLYTILTAFLLLAVVSLQAQSILLVNDNGKNPERVEPLKTALTDLGLPYTYFNTVENGVSPTADYMAPFDVVIWYTRNDSGGLYLWNAADTVNTELQAYLDNGATTEKPKVVIDTIRELYLKLDGSVHRGVHFLSIQMTEAYENARNIVKNFINAENTNEME